MSSNRDRFSRRDWLKLSAAGVAGLSTCGWFESLAASGAGTVAEGRRHKSCILLFMRGGPGQMFTFHPLPGGYAPTATSVPGVQICESLPRLARQMHHMAVLRSMSTNQRAHQPAMVEMHSGFRATTGIAHPSLGSIVSKELGDPEFPLPNYVVCGPVGGLGAGHLGSRFLPMIMQEATKGLAVLNNLRAVGDRVARQVNLVRDLDADFLDRFQAGSIDAHRQGYEGVLRMLQTPKVAAFDLSREPAIVRDRYGKGEFADRCLLARRLVEVGVPFVEVSLANWDTHARAYENQRPLCEQLDQPMAALIEDLHQRGMLEDTLVVWMGEFGRGPGDGGTHWPFAWTSVLAGAGLRTGQVIGRTDQRGGAVTERPISAAVFMATILQALGIRHTRNYRVRGQPFPMVEGGAEPIRELFS